MQEGAGVEAYENNAPVYDRSTRSSNGAADQIVALALVAGSDNVCMISSDYVDGLRTFGHDVMPLWPAS